MAVHHHIDPQSTEEDEDWPEMDMLKGDASWRGKYAAGYMAHLNALVEKHRAEYEQAKAERVASPEDRLARHLATIPLDIQKKGLSLTALQASLREQPGGHCNLGALGVAMRKLNFVRRRQWKDGGSGFCALWYPAESSGEQML